MTSLRLHYINEEVNPYGQTAKTEVDIETASVRANVNSLLSAVTDEPSLTPYIALERVRKVLAPYHIFVPAHHFMEGTHGHAVFTINQFGNKFGMTNDGEVVNKDTSEYHVYFEYQMNEGGSFDIFCEIVDDTDLEHILADYDEEYEAEEPEDEDEENEHYYDSDEEEAYRSNKKEHEGVNMTGSINEGSKALVMKYMKKAYKSLADAETIAPDNTIGRSSSTHTYARFDVRKRTKGIALATKKMMAAAKKT